MNFEPPDYSKNKSYGGNASMQHQKQGNYKRQFEQNPECSPLLKSTPNNRQYDKLTNGSSSSNNQQRSNVNQGYHFRNPIYNRLGNRNFQHRNNNLSDNPQSGTQGQRFNNRKRAGDNNTGGPMMPKRKWYPNSNQHSSASVQNRINRIRNTSDNELNVNNHSYGTAIESAPADNDVLEDPTDITVQVVNNSAVATTSQEPDVKKFKMILDPKTQSAIQLLQQKRKDKQVIFPFPVTPNVTGISLHQRFSLL